MLLDSSVGGSEFQKIIYLTKFQKLFIWPNKIKNDHVLDFYFHNNIWNGCTIFKRNNNSVESYNFLPIKDKCLTYDFYIESYRAIEHFMIYFKSKIRDIVNCLNSKNFCHFKHDIKFIESGQNTFTEFYNETVIKVYYLSYENKEVTLTPQEFECLKYYAQGKSMKEIAQIKTPLAPRTVEAHLEKVRRKTGCHRKSDLAKLYHANFPSLIMP